MNGSWYDRALDAIKVVGFPVAVCAFLLAQEAGYLPSQSREIARILRDHDQTSRDLTAAFNAQRVTQRAQVLLMTCLAYARTVDVQERCLSQFQNLNPTTP